MHGAASSETPVAYNYLEFPQRNGTLIKVGLGRKPWAHQDQPSIKATHTGITFLATHNPQTDKYERSRDYKKRYTGSKTCAVDINGKLWLNAATLDEEIKAAKDRKEGKPVKGAKQGHKKTGLARPVNVLSRLPGTAFEVATGTVQISLKKLVPGNFALFLAKKVRKKSYTVNKPEVRGRLLSYRNTNKGQNYLFFWTVSFPEGTPDKAAHDILNAWLTLLRKHGMIKEYLWIKERQLGDRLKDPNKLPTNTLHFHIAIPHYLSVTRANAMMRGTLKTYAKAGKIPGAYCDKRSGKVHYLNCIYNYNGVDIAKHKTTRKPINFATKKGGQALAHYLTKYVTKNDTEFEQLAWHNSRGFSCLFTGCTFTIEEFTRFGFGAFLNRVRVFRMEHCLFIPWLYGPPPLLEDHLYKLNSFIQNKFDEQRKQRAVV